MKIKYYNTRLESEKVFESFDKKILNTILDLTALNIIKDKNLLEQTKNTAENFQINKKRIIVFGTGGSNLGARALNNAILKHKIKIEFYDNIDPLLFEYKLSNIEFENTGFIVISKSGSTPETLSQLASMSELAKKNKLEEIFYKNTIIVSISYFIITLDPYK